MKTRAIWAILLVGFIYLGAGIVFGSLAGRAPSMQARVAWRWAAWAVSAIVFGAHIIYEQVWLRSTPRITYDGVAGIRRRAGWGIRGRPNPTNHVA